MFNSNKPVKIGNCHEEALFTVTLQHLNIVNKKI